MSTHTSTTDLTRIAGLPGSRACLGGQATSLEALPLKPRMVSLWQRSDGLDKRHAIERANATLDRINTSHFAMEVMAAEMRERIGETGERMYAVSQDFLAELEAAGPVRLVEVPMPEKAYPIGLRSEWQPVGSIREAVRELTKRAKAPRNGTPPEVRAAAHANRERQCREGEERRAALARDPASIPAKGWPPRKPVHVATVDGRLLVVPEVTSREKAVAIALAQMEDALGIEPQAIHPKPLSVNLCTMLSMPVVRADDVVKLIGCDV